MSEHRVRICWLNDTDSLEYARYTRDHVWQFAGGTELAASAAPEFRGNPAHVDPEAAFVAALSSCHMLSFLAIAARRRLVVLEYTDDAVGYLEKNAEGCLAVTRVELSPAVRFAAGAEVTDAAFGALHERAHTECFIANSVRTHVRCRARRLG